MLHGNEPGKFKNFVIFPDGEKKSGFSGISFIEDL
jgi:hypothetical protein